MQQKKKRNFEKKLKKVRTSPCWGGACTCLVITFMGALLEGKRGGCFKNQKVDVKRTSHGAANNCVSVSRYVYLVSFTMESSVVHAPFARTRCTGSLWY
jgi:hypothetical protein